MAYQVDKFNGTFLVSVDDGTIDTTTDLRFVGKNYAGYGEVQNENFLHLLENFANTTAPPKRITGQIWFDTGSKKLKFFDGTRFRTASGAEIGVEPPPGLQPGDMWFDTSAEQLYTWNGSEYILIGPEASPTTGESAAVQDTVKDDVNNNHSILKLVSEGEVVAILSADAFRLNTSNPITGFLDIKKGINLVNTNGTTGVTSTDHYFWGTSSNALKLGGFSATDFVRAGAATFSTGLSVADSGITIGDQNDLRIWVEDGNNVLLENQLGDNITFRIKTAIDLDVLRIGTTGVFPAADATFNLGTTGSSWLQVTASTFNGSLVGNVTGNTTGVHKGNVLASDNSVAYNATTKVYTGSLTGNVTGNVTGSVTGTATSASTLGGVSASEAVANSTIPIRNSSGNILANQFVGISDKSDRLRINDGASDTDPNYRSAKTTATASTIAARDASGDIYAVKFRGTATAAEYGDLAEKYLPDQDYEVGTVVSVGGEKEITASKFGDRAIGVISEFPAYLMNNNLSGGVAVALKGRVPVKVVGSIKKGDRLIAVNNGTAQKATHHSHSDVFAIALETNDEVQQKLVECIVI
jgi:hypothetical protein